jgi:large subunit ribosomal protein L19
MALKATFKDVEFGVGDKVRVVMKIKEEEGKFREANFEGMVLGIRGRDESKSFMVRKVAEGGIGVERIFPLNLPTIDRIILVKPGLRGVRRAKLYFTREKPPTEIEMIYKRAAIKITSKMAKKKPVKHSKSKSAPKKRKKQIKKKG